MSDGNEGAVRLVGILCEPGESPIIVEGHAEEGTGGSLALMQHWVGGFIEKADSYDFAPPVQVDVFVDEDGISKDLPENRQMKPGQVYLRGNILLAAADNSSGETISLDAIEGLQEFAVKIAEKFRSHS